MMWPQVKEVKDENRYELLITGNSLTDALDRDDGVLDPNIFDLHQLNFVRFANSSLQNLPNQIGNLENLTQLELQSNKLQSLPNSIGNLSKLKLLDVSENMLESLPQDIVKLKSLTTLYARQNKIGEIVSFDECSSLSVIDVRMNKLKSINELSYDKLTTLTEIHASQNEIEEVPSEIGNLVNLRVVNFSQNLIKEIPSDLLSCTKLKELELKGNPLSDRRFRKLVESDRGYAKVLLDYIKQHSKNGKGKAESGKKKNAKESADQAFNDVCHQLSVMSVKENVVVRVSDEVRSIRGYLVCCILRNVDLSGTNLKKFLSVQTKLHDTVCEKRLAATIATHDLTKVRSPLCYCAKAPDAIRIQPLNKSTKVSAKEFLKTLKDEAEAQRKQMKRNSCTGIHKYLTLVEGLEKWPCIVDSNDTVISFPPITNSHDTKIEAESNDILVEVTCNSTLKKAKEVMDAVVMATLEAGLCKERTGKGKFLLKVEQVRVGDEDGNLRLVYPSKTDLVIDGQERRIVVVRA